MKKVARREGPGEEPLLSGLRTFVQRELREFVVAAGMSALTALLEMERTQVCGARYAHLPERRAHRGGHAQGESRARRAEGERSGRGPTPWRARR